MYVINVSHTVVQPHYRASIIVDISLRAAQQFSQDVVCNNSGSCFSVFYQKRGSLAAISAIISPFCASFFRTNQFHRHTIHGNLVEQFAPCIDDAGSFKAAGLWLVVPGGLGLVWPGRRLAWRVWKDAEKNDSGGKIQTERWINATRAVFLLHFPKLWAVAFARCR